jgi:hypothetical protein
MSNTQLERSDIPWPYVSFLRDGGIHWAIGKKSSYETKNLSFYKNTMAYFPIKSNFA